MSNKGKIWDDKLILDLGYISMETKLELDKAC